MPGRLTVIAADLLVCMGWLVPSNARSQAQLWPDRPVRIVVPFAPGGATDQTAGVWADKLTQAFG